MAEVDAGQVASVENAPASSIAVPAPDAPAGQDQANQQPVQPKTFTEEEVRKTVSERLAKERRRLERVARAEAERDYLRQQLQAQQQPRTQASVVKQPTDFKTYEEYVEYRIEQALEQRMKAREQESQTQRQQREAQEQSARLRERLSEGASEFDDFEEVALADHVPISTAMAAAISESDIPAKLAYYLGSHLDEAKRIHGLPPTKQVREISKIEDQLTSTPKPKPAPEPIKPNSGSASIEKPIEEQSYDDFVKTRHRQLAAKGKRRYQTS